MIIFGVIQVHKVVPTWNEALAKNGSPKKRLKHGEDHVKRSGVWKPFIYIYIYCFLGNFCSNSIFSHPKSNQQFSSKKWSICSKRTGQERFPASMFTGFQMFCFRTMYTSWCGHPKSRSITWSDLELPLWKLSCASTNESIRFLDL